MTQLEEKILEDTSSDMYFVISWLVWPVALTSLVTLGYRCFKQKIILDALPLLATQFNAALFWGCLAAH